MILIKSHFDSSVWLPEISLYNWNYYLKKCSPCLSSGFRVCSVLQDYFYYIPHFVIVSINIDRLSTFVDNYNTATIIENHTHKIVKTENLNPV